jgi:diguanylate cyclase (GGDEF)-like protein
MGDQARPPDARKILDRLLDTAIPGDNSWLEHARQERANSGISVFSELIRALTHVRLAEKESEELWPELLTHWREISAALGRDVGLPMALFDWFVNIDPKLKEPVLLERTQLEKTERSAMTDWLTGLYNRGAFRAAALRELRRAQRYRQQLSLILLDLDDFKKINDGFGHERGDQVLKEISRLLRRSIRDVDVPARHGGEEFAILLPETGRQGARAVAERVRTAFGRHGALQHEEGEPLAVTVSAGIAVYPEDGEELGELLRQADVALYRAKAAGKNRTISEWEERRLARRIVLGGARARVAFKRGDESLVLEGQARDLSATGVGVVLPQSCEVGQLLELSLEGAGLAERPVLYGRVVRFQEVRTGSVDPCFDVGVALDEASRGAAAAAIEVISGRNGRAAPRERSARP